MYTPQEWRGTDLLTGKAISPPHSTATGGYDCFACSNLTHNKAGLTLILLWESALVPKIQADKSYTTPVKKINPCVFWSWGGGCGLFSTDSTIFLHEKVFGFHLFVRVLPCSCQSTPLSSYRQKQVWHRRWSLGTKAAASFSEDGTYIMQIYTILLSQHP